MIGLGPDVRQCAATTPPVSIAVACSVGGTLSMCVLQ